METENRGLPRENLFRCSMPGVELRDNTEGVPTLYGHFSVFNTPTEINSMREGRFIERIAPGAFKKTFSDRANPIRLLFQHGRDPQVGDKPIGTITDLREDDTGAYYEASLFDGLPELVMDGLRAGEYGASFRFQVTREDVAKKPGKSPANPDGIPERTIREANVMEFGPVTFGAYKEATAGIRSISDEMDELDTLRAAALLVNDPDKMELLRSFIVLPAADEEVTLIEDAPPVDAEPQERAHLDNGRRVTTTAPKYRGAVTNTESWRLRNEVDRGVSRSYR